MTVNLIELAKSTDRPPTGAPIELLRLGPNEVAFRLFTADATPVTLHYLDAPGYGTYVQCPGDDCPLCQAGVRKEERLLIPVYDMLSRSVRALSVSRSSSPGSLFPQLLPALRMEKPQALLASKPDRMTFRVATREIGAGVDDGSSAIERFLRRWRAGAIDLASVYPRYEPRVLAEIPAVASMLSLKGLSVGPTSRIALAVIDPPSAADGEADGAEPGGELAGATS